MTQRENLPNRRLNATQEFERDGIRITMTVGGKSDGSIGETSNADRANAMIDVLMSDAAIIASLALQHGVPLQQIAQHAIKRDVFGIASSPIGAAIDRVSTLEEVRS